MLTPDETAILEHELEILKPILDRTADEHRQMMTDGFYFVTIARIAMALIEDGQFDHLKGIANGAMADGCDHVWDELLKFASVFYSIGRATEKAGITLRSVPN